MLWRALLIFTRFAHLGWIRSEHNWIRCELFIFLCVFDISWWLYQIWCFKWSTVYQLDRPCRWSLLGPLLSIPSWARQQMDSRSSHSRSLRGERAKPAKPAKPPEAAREWWASPSAGGLKKGSIPIQPKKGSIARAIHLMYTALCNTDKYNNSKYMNSVTFSCGLVSPSPTYGVSCLPQAFVRKPTCLLVQTCLCS